MQASKILWASKFLSVNQRVLPLRSTHSGVKKLNPWDVMKQDRQDLHLTGASVYPQAQNIPLPSNVEDISAIETVQFSPQRARDITGDVIVTQNASINPSVKEDLSADRFIESYDCSGTVSLNSAMQTNVPDPYAAKGKSTHLNMPGGDWGRSDKYVAQDLQNSHYSNIKDRCGGMKVSAGLQSKKGTYPYLQVMQALHSRYHLHQYSTLSSDPDKKENNENSRNDKVAKLKKAIKDYGATVIVFHVGISLISLGGFYLAVTSGIDVSWLSFGKEDLPREVPGEVGAFVIAYAIHKMFAPVRISLTLVCTPIIVRHLRKVGLLGAKKAP